jgi:hypothetical protein
MRSDGSLDSHGECKTHSPAVNSIHAVVDLQLLTLRAGPCSSVSAFDGHGQQQHLGTRHLLDASLQSAGSGQYTVALKSPANKHRSEAVSIYVSGTYFGNTACTVPPKIVDIFMRLSTHVCSSPD